MVEEAHVKNKTEDSKEAEARDMATVLLQRQEEEENNIQHARQALKEVRAKANDAQRNQTLLENSQFARLHSFLQEIAHYRRYITLLPREQRLFSPYTKQAISLLCSLHTVGRLLERVARRSRKHVSSATKNKGRTTHWHVPTLSKPFPSALNKASRFRFPPPPPPLLTTAKVCS